MLPIIGIEEQARLLILFPIQHGHHWPRAIDRRLRTILHRVVRSQVRDTEAGAVCEDLDVQLLLAKLGQFDCAHHVERRLARLVRYVQRSAPWSGVDGAIQGAGSAADIDDAGGRGGLAQQRQDGLDEDRGAADVDRKALLHMVEKARSWSGDCLGGIVHQGVQPVGGKGLDVDSVCFRISE